MAGPQCTCLPASPFINGVISSPEIQSLKIIEINIKEEIIFNDTISSTTITLITKRTGRKACTLTAANMKYYIV
jgi:hypothetical protein